MEPKFNLLIFEEIKRYNNTEICKLISLDESQFISNVDLDTITSICNEDSIFNTLVKNIEKF